MTQTISTIVDLKHKKEGGISVYMTQTISTIVDVRVLTDDEKRVYMTQTISTIVDLQLLHRYNEGLYDPNNFYYCRYILLHLRISCVYMTQTISTIVDMTCLLHPKSSI